MGTTLRQSPWTASSGSAAIFLLALVGWPVQALAYEAVPIDDTFLEANSTQINGRTETLRVGDDGDVLKYTSYIKFDLSTLPADLAAENIQRAILKLFVSEVAAAGEFEIRQVLNDWDEDTLDEDPGTGAFVAGPITVDEGEEYVLVDLTLLVADLVSTGSGVANIALIPLESPGEEKSIYVHFDGKESDDTSHDPRLEIVLVSVGPTG